MSVNHESQNNVRRFETVNWVIVTVLVIVAIIGNYIYRDVAVIIRSIIVVLLMIIAGGIALMTAKGRAAITFVREAKIEMRKVIWPTPQESLQTTLIVILVTSVMSLILWSLDGILVHLVSFITRLRF